ncbi:Flotillin [Trema orientale]|uniref:Flotillin-like n=1 Tax=Trema orientale TaxID=63057 RepID=A0A2P5ESJ3_TREOI|nr:Flotillin [Trema orientale]
MINYRVASPSEYLAITGSGIDDIKLAKKALIWPFQRCTRLDVSPVNYTFDVQAMSSEKLPFILPAVFTIGPKADDENACLLYAKLVSSHDKHSNHVNELVQGIIEGETRVLAASMTMEEIFMGTKEFKKAVFEKVQVELSQFGLLIYNANVKQLVDVRGQEYFSYLGQRTQVEAANRAKIDTAEAKKKGDIGAKLREAQTAQNEAEIDAQTKIISTQRQGEGRKGEIKVKAELKIFENQREGDVLESDTALATKKAECDKEAQLAKVEAKNTVDIRDAELKTKLEKKNAETQTEKLRANLLSKATVDYEIKVQEANWDLYKNQRVADADLYGQRQVAEAQKASAEANAFARQQVADSELYAKKKEAEGIIAIAKAEGLYLNTLMKQLGGNYGAVRDYMMIKNNMFQEIAKINAQAINGLQPKISLWSQGNNEKELSGGTMKDIAGVYSLSPPLFKTVHEQTGMLPPACLGALPDSNGV